jgi:hypothetical protein
MIKLDHATKEQELISIATFVNDFKVAAQTKKFNDLLAAVC